MSATRRWSAARVLVDESGAALVLALVFIVAVALTLVALLNLTGSDLLNSSNLRSERILEYAADSATTAAVQQVRFSGNPYTTSGSCMPTGMVIQDSQVPARTLVVDCSGQPPAVSPASRIVQFFACTSSTCDSSNAIVKANVTFNDYASNGNLAFGSGMIINSWLVTGANS
jgi:Tfp pilus assembly protein PilX